MAGSFKKGAIPPDPRVVIPKLELLKQVANTFGGVYLGVTGIGDESLQQLIADSKNVRG